MSLRKDFVLMVLGEEMTVVDACKHFGISRKTGYKWIQRYEEQGVVGLGDLSRRPKRSPRKTSPAMTKEIVALRKQHPTWGGKKIHRLLVKQFGFEEAPAAKTIERLLARAGLVRRYRKRRPPITRTPTPSPVVAAPNDLWTVDFKGWWRTLDNMRCEPLTVRDAFSRFVFVARPMSPKRVEVKAVFEELFCRYGLPVAIQSDNGSPFANTRALGAFTKLSAWWASLGIVVVRSRPAHPQDNGGHERMHADLYREVERYRAVNLKAQVDTLLEWVHEFNYVRPHEALGMKTPAEVYTPDEPSSRPYLSGLIYCRPGCTPVKVNRQGDIFFGAWSAYASMNLAGHVVGIDAQPGHVLVWLGRMLLGHFVPGEHESVQAGIPDPSPLPTTLVAPRPSTALAAPSTTTPEVDFNFLW